MKSQTIFKCRVELVLDIPPGELPVLKEVNYDLRLPQPGPLKESMYLDADMMPTGAGIKVISNAFVQALVSNVQAADTMSLWKPEEHIEWIISEFQRALAAGATYKSGINSFKSE